MIKQHHEQSPLRTHAQFFHSASDIQKCDKARRKYRSYLLIGRHLDKTLDN